MYYIVLHLVAYTFTIVFIFLKYNQNLECDSQAFHPFNIMVLTAKEWLFSKPFLGFYTQHKFTILQNLSNTHNVYHELLYSNGISSYIYQDNS